MPNPEREGEDIARTRLNLATREGLRQSVLDLQGDIDVPLRDALRMVRVLGMVETPTKLDDAHSIAYLAREAAIRLETVSDGLRGLFASCLLDV